MEIMQSMGVAADYRNCSPQSLRINFPGEPANKLWTFEHVPNGEK